MHFRFASPAPDRGHPASSPTVRLPRRQLFGLGNHFNCELLVLLQLLLFTQSRVCSVGVDLCTKRLRQGRSRACQSATSTHPAHAWRRPRNYPKAACAKGNESGNAERGKHTHANAHLWCLVCVCVGRQNNAASAGHTFGRGRTRADVEIDLQLLGRFRSRKVRKFVRSVALFGYQYRYVR